MRLVYAATQTTVACEGQRIMLRPGEAWNADDPVVARYPDLFTDQPIAVRVTTTSQGWAPYGDDDAGDEAPVETARQAPGEKRPGPIKRASKAAKARKRPAGG